MIGYSLTDPLSQRVYSGSSNRFLCFHHLKFYLAVHMFKLQLAWVLVLPMASLQCHLRKLNWDEVWPVLECLHGRFPSKTPGVNHSLGLTTPFESTVIHCPRTSKTASSRPCDQLVTAGSRGFHPHLPALFVFLKCQGRLQNLDPILLDVHRCM